jgi:ATP-dependent protease ClpP protease subunit
MAEAKVYISGPIVADSSEAGNIYPYTTLEDVMLQLEYQKPFDAVRVVINSPGGRVDKGLGMFDYLTSLPGVTITTEAIGQCSSIANAVFLAGDVRLAHTHVESLVHLPSGGAVGVTAAEAQQFADEMAECQQRLIALYVERAGVDEAAITALMSAQTVLTAEQLLANGIATQIVQPATALALAPKTASSTSTSPDGEQMPSWAEMLMSKFNQGLAAMASAMNLAKKPATAQADSDTAATALDVTTVGGATLTIDTGDRSEYQVGDAVTDADGNPAADDTYSLSDGNDILVAEGAISEIKPTEDTTDATASADVTAAITQLVSTVTALAGEVGGLKTQFAAQAKVVNRVATTAGSRATPPRASAAGDDAAAEVDPIKTAGDARKARREARFKKP